MQLDNMNLKKIVITSLVGSIGLAVLSLSLSLAWYNTSENLYLDTVVVKVNGDADISISTSGEPGTFVESLKYEKDAPKNDLDDAGLFSPVSSMFKSNWIEDDSKNEPDLYIYPNSSVNMYYAPQVESAPWGYYKQHLYLYSSSDVLVTLDSKNFTLNEIEKTNEEYANYLFTQVHVRKQYEETHPDWTKEQIIADILAKLAVLKKCMRVGVYDVSNRKLFILDPYKDGDTYLGGRADLFMTKYYDYHPESDNQLYETIYGEVNDRTKAVYKDVADTDSPAPETYSSFHSRTRANVHALDMEASIANGMEIAKEDSLSLANIEDKMFIPLKSGEAKEIVLLAYMEGWDIDCTNQHMGSSFNLNMKFKISERRQ